MDEESLSVEIREAYRTGHTMTHIASVLGISVQKATALRDQGADQEGAR